MPNKTYSCNTVHACSALRTGTAVARTNTRMPTHAHHGPNLIECHDAFSSP